MRNKLLSGTQAKEERTRSQTAAVLKTRHIIYVAWSGSRALLYRKQPSQYWVLLRCEIVRNIESKSSGDVNCILYTLSSMEVFAPRVWVT